MTIKASGNPGSAGPDEGEPTVVEWHWYYHLIGLVDWALLLALLVLLKENRTPQAWTILIPFFLLGDVFWPPFARALELPHDCSNVWYWLVTTLSILWLLSFRFGHVRPLRATAFAVFVIAMLGVVAASGIYPCWSILWLVALVFYGMSIVPLLAANILGAWCCRGRYRPLAFMAWLALWLVIATGICNTVLLLFGGGGRASIENLVFLPTVCSAVSYFLNLPFMILAFKCPLYRERFQRVFGLSEGESPTMPDEVATDDAVVAEDAL